jgi:predicted dinucleotide-binding enzyme
LVILPAVQVVEGDMRRSETLSDALSGVDRALLISSSDQRMAETQLAFIDVEKPEPRNTEFARRTRMRIGIIGAGSMGEILARRLAKLGHDVLIANSRGSQSLIALAAEIGATAVSVADATTAGDIVIIAIPTKAVADLPRALFAGVADSVVVIDIGNYHPELRDGRIDAIDHGMPDSQWVARQIGRPVIKAFNNILATSLVEKSVPKGASGRIALSVAGDSPDAKAAVLGLVDDLGFDPVDGGDLDSSWRQQPGTPAYCRDLDAAALRRALAEADRSRIAEYRAEREAQIRRDIAVQTPSA